jgi:hypothetical protein
VHVGDILPITHLSGDRDKREKMLMTANDIPESTCMRRNLGNNDREIFSTVKNLSTLRI